MTKSEKALEYFGNNFNCAQSVFATFAEDFGLSEEMALKLGTSFGGGARNAEMCGAISGALLVLGLKYGHYQAENQEQKSFNYNLSLEYTNRFKKRCGSIVCRDLLDADLTTEEGKAKIAKDNLFRTLCPQIIEIAVKVLEEVLKENA